VTHSTTAKDRREEIRYDEIGHRKAFKGELVKPVIKAVGSN